MKHFLFLFFVFFTSCATAPKSPVYVHEGGRKLETLPTTYAPLAELGNVHTMRNDGRILRGASPAGKASLLKENGVTDVLIFRNGTDEEIKHERDELERAGFEPSRITHIAMPWKDISDQNQECRKTIKALLLIGEVERNSSRKMYFHCTVGEDRTGMLAGLYRVFYQGWTPEKAFREEMCEHGFAEASIRKPVHVAQAVNAAMKPLYARVATLVHERKVISPELCDTKAHEKQVQKLSALTCAP